MMLANARPRSITKIEGLDQKLNNNNTAILADTLHFESELPVQFATQTILSSLNIALSLHDFAGAILNHRGVYEALAAKQLDYYIWVAVKKVSDNWKKYVPLPLLVYCQLDVAQGWMGCRAKGVSDKGSASIRKWHSGPNYIYTAA
jgi:hypothetical protein